MPAPSSPPSADPCAEEAVRWCVARHGGAWSAADAAAFEQWLAADAAHRQAYEKVAGVWALAGALNEGATRPDEAHATSRWSPLPPRPLPAPARLRHGFAFVVAALVLLPLALWQGERWWQGAPQTLTTAPGESKRLALADGSEIQLDGDSEAVVRVGQGGRSAQLKRGAAFFVVAHDAARPFAVAAGAGRVVDLGTRFNVDVLLGQVRVEVFEGRVLLATPQGELSLAAGEGAGYDDHGALSPPVAVAGELPDWRQGRLVFRDEPLAAALARIARYHRVQFEFADPALASLRISGQFRSADLGLFLRTLETAFSLRTVPSGAGRIRLSRAASTRLR